ncbi:MAG TPA: hypothetical protein VMZ11_05330 [Mycobacteriales bacterium]|nr:hypothetical protein [Mycobacteriales bacterium]
MNARLVLAGVLVCAVGGGLAAPAMASSPEKKHKICVLGPTPAYPNQEGICVAFDAPFAAR